MDGLIGLEGKEWQNLCVQVLRRRYASDLVVVPDKDGGDGGLEAYTFFGHLFQCYSPEEPLTVKKRYESHREKITGDVTKFITNKDKKLSRLFGNHVKIKRWILMVPVIDSKEFVSHCANQTDRIREACLTYADPDIHVIGQTMEDYEESYKSVVNAQLANLHLPALSEPDYTAIDSTLTDTMKGKLRKVRKLGNDTRVGQYMQRLLISHVEGEEYRSYIRDHFTALDLKLDELLEDLEERLVIEFALDDDPPHGRLKRVLEEAEKRVNQAIPEVRAGQARQIARGQVADWLMRCPLDFDEEEVP